MKLIPKTKAPVKIFDKRTLSIDPSPNGTGIIYCEGTIVKNWWVATNTKKWLKAFPDNCFYVNKVVKKDENQRLERTDRTLRFVEKLLKKYFPDYITIEDYVPSAGPKSGGLYQIAELGGPLRMLCSKYALVRTNDPTSVKLAFTGSGNATKEDMIEQVKRLAFEFTSSDIVDQWDQLPDKIFENVADAYANFYLLKNELMLREGMTTISEMPERLIRVFNRVTLAQPNCLLDRPFIDAYEWSKI
jgi:Holliday junction resolvasome RuvABC endonuclease subunit